MSKKLKKLAKESGTRITITKDTYTKYPGIGTLLPAMGYGKKQIQELEDTINAVDCDIVIIGTPIDLSRIIKINKKSIRVKYELQEIGRPGLEEILNQKIKVNDFRKG